MTKKDIKDEEIEIESETDEESQEVKKEEWELEQLKAKFEESEISHKRALADYQNLQKRVAEERRNLILSSNQDLLLRILSVLDTLLLAQKHDASEGLKVSISQFLDILKAEGVTRIKTEEREFDPHLMEAVAIGEQDPSASSGQGNKVLEELRPGFMLNDKVLRVAQVKVSKG